ncbi:MAG: Alpha/beta hydrolase family, partial [Chthonomonadaceae bacterium]|nr:Alpha/beta hydrolase family [Chthonomonadaceae bacterium]
LAVAAVGFACATLAYAYVATHPPRRRFTRTPSEVDLEFEEVVFPSQDGLKISGWFLPAPFPEEAQGVIVFCHGYPQNRLEMLPYAQFLHEAGFATLVFDFRALGRSEGSLCSFGHAEIADLRGALDYLDSRSDIDVLPRGVFGLSLGASVAIMASAQDERVEAVVAEAPYPSLRDALNKRLSVVFGPLGVRVATPILWWAKRWLTFDPSAVSPAAVVQNLAPRPLLLIQGQRDMLVNWRDSERMAKITEASTELWLMPEAGHAQCFRKGGEEYTRRVTQFFQKNLNRE